MQDNRSKTGKIYTAKSGYEVESNRKLGSQKEQQAKQYLEQHGYQILEKNFYAKGGEIDLIGREDGYLVFIEVKYRANEALGHPLEAVTPVKQNKIRYTAHYYMHKNGISEDTPCRFDVVAILGDEITVIKDAF